MTNRREINGPDWCCHVRYYLLGGYGVEDIAIFLKCHVSHVRAYVSEMRQSGALAMMFSRGKGT